MKVQSLSVVVPSTGCMNKCAFCVACMHKSPYEDMVGKPNLYSGLYAQDYIDRLDYARSNGCNVLMITGDAEPQQNYYFLEKLGFYIKLMKKPFENIEIQTTGSAISNDWLFFLRNNVRVSTISLSVSSFVDTINNEIIGTPEKINLGMGWESGYINLKELCQKIKKYRFNLRLSINLTSSFNEIPPAVIFDYAKKELGADQITFRVLYKSTEIEEDMTPQDKWILKNGQSNEALKNIQNYVSTNGRFDRKLEFGQNLYFCHGLSTVIDDDSMDSKKFRGSLDNVTSEELANDPKLMIQAIANAIIKEQSKDAIKYLILQKNAKLYTSWDADVVHY